MRRSSGATKALTRAYAAQTDKRQFCAIGSVKPNIGHLDAAAGVSSLIKTVLALEHKRLPPVINFERLNPKIELESSPFYVSTTSQPWTAATVRDVVFDGASSVNVYYQTASYGKLALTGDVFGWYPLADDNTGCRYTTWASEAPPGELDAVLRLLQRNQDVAGLGVLHGIHHGLAPDLVDQELNRRRQRHFHDVHGDVHLGVAARLIGECLERLAQSVAADRVAVQVSHE